MGAINSPQMNLLNRIEKCQLEGPIGWSPIDAITVAALLHENVIILVLIYLFEFQIPKSEIQTGNKVREIRNFYNKTL